QRGIHRDSGKAADRAQACIAYPEFDTLIGRDSEEKMFAVGRPLRTAKAWTCREYDGFAAAVGNSHQCEMQKSLRIVLARIGRVDAHPCDAKHRAREFGNGRVANGFGDENLVT